MDFYCQNQRRMILHAFVFVVLFICRSYAGTDKSSGGIAVHLGFGSLYGGMGASCEYHLPVSPLWRFSPFLSAGTTMPIYSSDNIYRFGYCVGINAEFGRYHRLFIGPSFGSQYLDYDRDLLDHYSNINTVVGPAMVLGYKGTASFGLLWLIYCGMSYLINDQHPDDKPGFAPAFGLGLGYTFW